MCQLRFKMRVDYLILERMRTTATFGVWLCIIGGLVHGQEHTVSAACPHAWFNCRHTRDTVRCYHRLDKLKVYNISLRIPLPCFLV